MILFIVLFSLGALVSACAVIYPFKPFKSRGFATLSFIGCVLLNGVVGIAGFESTNHSPTDAKTTDPGLKVGNQIGHEAVPLAETPNWSYHTSNDEMTGVQRKTACTTSTNELEFAFPYNGGSEGELCFRRRGKSLDAWVQVTKGQFICGVEDCVLHLKFDNGPIQGFSAVQSKTDETGFLFLEPASRLLTLASRAKQLRLQADYFQEGQKVLYFELSGLDIKQL